MNPWLPSSSRSQKKLSGSGRWTPGFPPAATIHPVGGEVLNRIEHDRPIFGCALGGSDRWTLFLLASEWRGTDQVADVVTARTGQVLTVQAPAPGGGWP